MITEDQLQLITAAIDGELSDREIIRLERLLGDSTEAQVIHDKLKADRDRLRNLPIVPHPVDLHARVMAGIEPLAIAPVCRLETPRHSTRKTWPWAPVAIAATTGW